MTPPAQPLMSAADTLVQDLQAALPHGRVVVDADVARSLSQDQAAGAPVGEPAAVVRARSTEEVRQVVEICLRHRTPVVARGAGTGLQSGGRSGRKRKSGRAQNDGGNNSRPTAWRC